MSDAERSMFDLEGRVRDLEYAVRDLKWKCRDGNQVTFVNSPDAGTSEADAIRVLSEAASETKAEKKGACVYTAGTGTYCAELTKSQCKKLKGAWTEGGKCP